MKVRIFVFILSAMGALTLASCSSEPREPVSVSLVAVNDFHGYLLPIPQLTLDVPDAAGTGDIEVRVGGAAYLASLVKDIRANTKHSLFVGVGDFVGGAPAISAFTAHESTIEVMNLMGLAVTPVGNHEFDNGKLELKRLQQGGCASTFSAPNVKICSRSTFAGASFPFLAANVVDDTTGALLFPATHTQRFGDATIGFIGLTLQGTASTTRGAGGFTFLSEVPVIKTHAARLKAEGVDAVVVLLHEGGNTTASSLVDSTCPGLKGVFREIVEALPREVDVVLSGHTHADYVCEINGILVSQAGSYGRFATRVDLSILPGRGVRAKAAKNIPVINDLTTAAVPAAFKVYSADPDVKALVDFYDKATSEARSREMGFIAEPIARIETTNGVRINVADHPIGRVMADAFLEIRGPKGEAADIALINNGGLRGTLLKTADGKVDYEALFAIAPFGNAIVMVEMTGASLIRLLEQQWEAPNCARKYNQYCGRVLQISANFAYTWRHDAADQGKPVGSGQMVDISTVRVNGQPLDLTKTYKILTSDFVADGGDNFTVLASSRLSFTDMVATDMEALQAYFNKFPSSAPLRVPPPRVTCIHKSDGRACDIPVN